LALERRVGGAEGNGLGRDLLDAAAGPDRLVVHADSGLLLVGVCPLGIDRIRKGRSGAGNIEGGGGRGDGHGEQAGYRQSMKRFQCSLLLLRPEMLRRRGLEPTAAVFRLWW